MRIGNLSEQINNFISRQWRPWPVGLIVIFISIAFVQCDVNAQGAVVVGEVIN